MFDHHIICDDSLRNVQRDGETIGFSIQARLPYYRGLGLSMVEDLAVTIDGTAVPREAIRFSVRGRSWTLDEMETEYADRWNFGEVAEILVMHPGGLSAGSHEVSLAERLRISYLPFVPTTGTTRRLTIA